MEIAGTNPFSAARTSARAAAPPAWNAVEGPHESRITKRSQIHPANAQYFFNEGYWSADLQNQTRSRDVVGCHHRAAMRRGPHLMRHSSRESRSEKRAAPSSPAAVEGRKTAGTNPLWRSLLIEKNQTKPNSLDECSVFFPGGLSKSQKQSHCAHRGAMDYQTKPNDVEFTRLLYFSGPLHLQGKGLWARG